LQSHDDFEFAHLAGYVKSSLRAVTNSGIVGLGAAEHPRLVLVLIGLDAVVNKIQKKILKEGVNRSVMSLVDNAIPYVLYTLDVEVVRWKNVNEACNYLHTLTRIVHRSFSDGISQQISEIEHVVKAGKRKAEDAPGLDTKSEKEVERFELRETWSAMLQMIPRVSTRRAQALVDHPAYSCFKKTFDALNNAELPQQQRELLLEYSFAAAGDADADAADVDAEAAVTAIATGGNKQKKKTKKPSRQAKLALNVYKSLRTGTDPNTPLDD
jgi:hypothetical protein